MLVAARWLGGSSIAGAVVLLFTSSVRVEHYCGESICEPAEELLSSTKSPSEVLELGRCSELPSTNWHNVEFDACVQKFPDEIMSRRDEDGQLIVVASMYTDFAICAVKVSCSIRRAATEPTRRWHVWRQKGDAFFGWDQGTPKVCGITDAGGIRATIDEEHEVVTVETEVGTKVDQCMRWSSFELVGR